MCAIVVPDPVALIQCVNSLVILLIQTRISDRVEFLKTHLNLRMRPRRCHCIYVRTYLTNVANCLGTIRFKSHL